MTKENKARVEVVKQGNENATGLIRRFTKRVQNSGVVKRARGLRYAEREQSKYVRRKQALKRIEKTKHIERLKKLGRM